MEWEVQKRKELENPPEPEPIRLTFSQASTIYLKDCRARFQKNTWRLKAFVYRNFLSFINEDPPADSITDNYIKTFDLQLRQVANILDEQENFNKKKEKGTI